MSQNLRIFCPLLGTVHYWGLLLNKNGWEAGFCPLLGAFPLLGSALLGEYSVSDHFVPSGSHISAENLSGLIFSNT